MHLYLTRLYLLRLTLFGLSLVALLAVATTLASAAEVSAAPTINLGGLWDSLAPLIRAFGESCIAALLGWVAVRIHRWTGLQIEARHREALHSAAVTGANLALDRLGERAGNTSIEVRSAVLAEAYDWVVRSTPDALAYFGLGPDRVRQLIESKLSAIAAKEFRGGPASPEAAAAGETAA